MADNITIKDGTGASVTVRATDNASVFLPWHAAVGNVADDAADSGNPIKAGGIARTSFRTPVAANDRVDATFDIYGRQVVAPYANPENLVSGTTSDITTTAATTCLAAPGAGLKNYVTHIVVQNSHATVSTWVNITEETSGTVLYTVYAAAAGGGASCTLPAPLTQATANKAIQITCATSGANVRASMSGYKAP